MESNDSISPKEKLEIEKLQTEIKDIKRRIIPQWVGALSPFLIGLMTIIIAFSTGFLNNQATLNKIEAHKVEVQVKEFEAKRDSLHLSNDSLLALNSQLNFEREKLKKDSQRLSVAFENMKNDEKSKKGQVAELIIKVNELENSKNYLQDQLGIIDVLLKKKIEDTSHFYER